MNASVEITAGIIRLHPPGAAFGGPFDWSVAFVGDEGVATLKGLVGTVGVGRAKEIAGALRDVGFHTARWTRHGGVGGVREVRVPLNPLGGSGG